MKHREIRLEGPGAKGTAVNATALRHVLELALAGSQRALRMRMEGRSAARGSAPPWLEPTSDFVVEIHPGSTVLAFEVPSLIEACPQEFQQQTLFTDISPDDTAFDYFVEALDAASHGADSTLYDRSMLQFFGGFASVFDKGVETIEVLNGRAVPLVVVRETLGAFRDLERSIPAPQYVQLAGTLDSIRFSDRTFSLRPASGPLLKGVAEKSQLDALQKNWGESVLVSGTCYFTPAGRVLRIEADTIRPATDVDTQLWALVPEPLFGHGETIQHVQQQGPRSGLNAIFGRWPGDESDDDVADALAQLS